ncbi:hypothetical protein P154DRAFT_580905 [Amniculicola lignicola CBS 123094]|uniref:Uncharacterized protein n=1 Tax=Amniculicola lignicola CBS 123094 TaxID=1392246 RepID=A0A6A5W895_9PLEO|nr:hypothetical protein P154DRAFT_580905 [Amniculicola lignicola CBS 123094]
MASSPGSTSGTGSLSQSLSPSFTEAISSPTPPSTPSPTSPSLAPSTTDINPAPGGMRDIYDDHYTSERAPKRLRTLASLSQKEHKAEIYEIPEAGPKPSLTDRRHWDSEAAKTFSSVVIAKRLRNGEKKAMSIIRHEAAHEAAHEEGERRTTVFTMRFEQHIESSLRRTNPWAGISNPWAKFRAALPAPQPASIKRCEPPSITSVDKNKDNTLASANLGVESECALERDPTNIVRSTSQKPSANKDGTTETVIRPANSVCGSDENEGPKPARVVESIETPVPTQGPDINEASTPTETVTEDDITGANPELLPKCGQKHYMEGELETSSPKRRCIRSLSFRLPSHLPSTAATPITCPPTLTAPINPAEYLPPTEALPTTTESPIINEPPIQDPVNTSRSPSEKHPMGRDTKKDVANPPNSLPDSLTDVSKPYGQPCETPIHPKDQEQNESPSAPRLKLSAQEEFTRDKVIGPANLEYDAGGDSGGVYEQSSESPNTHNEGGQQHTIETTRHATTQNPASEIEPTADEKNTPCQTDSNHSMLPCEEDCMDTEPDNLISLQLEDPLSTLSAEEKRAHQYSIWEEESFCAMYPAMDTTPETLDASDLVAVYISTSAEEVRTRDYRDKERVLRYLSYNLHKRPQKEITGATLVGSMRRKLKAQKRRPRVTSDVDRLLFRTLVKPYLPQKQRRLAVAASENEQGPGDEMEVEAHETATFNTSLQEAPVDDMITDSTGVIPLLGSSQDGGAPVDEMDVRADDRPLLIPSPEGFQPPFHEMILHSTEAVPLVSSSQKSEALADEMDVGSHDIAPHIASLQDKRALSGEVYVGSYEATISATPSQFEQAPGSKMNFEATGTAPRMDSKMQTPKIPDVEAVATANSKAYTSDNASEALKRDPSLKSTENLAEKILPDAKEKTWAPDSKATKAATSTAQDEGDVAGDNPAHIRSSNKALERRKQWENPKRPRSHPIFAVTNAHTHLKFPGHGRFEGSTWCQPVPILDMSGTVVGIKYLAIRPLTHPELSSPAIPTGQFIDAGWPSKPDLMLPVYETEDQGKIATKAYAVYRTIYEYEDDKTTPLQKLAASWKELDLDRFLGLSKQECDATRETVDQSLSKAWLVGYIYSLGSKLQEATGHLIEIQPRLNRGSIELLNSWNLHDLVCIYHRMFHLMDRTRWTEESSEDAKRYPHKPGQFCHAPFLLQCILRRIAVIEMYLPYKGIPVTGELLMEKETPPSWCLEFLAKKEESLRDEVRKEKELENMIESMGW